MALTRSDEVWPELPYERCVDTLTTLHRWAQVVGKIRLETTPTVNHWWNTTLYVTVDGLTTSPMPYGTDLFQIDFCFRRQELRIAKARGEQVRLPLRDWTVADFYTGLMRTLEELGIRVPIWTTPVEIDDRMPFEQDHRPRPYDPQVAERYWHALLQVDRVLKRFRSRFVGKASPVHFFWGSMDLAASRFSGRPAPRHPGGPNVARYVMEESYSHEVSSAGFWPGDARLGGAAFYSYVYPEPPGFRDYPVSPAEASYDGMLGEFVLPYDAVRTASDPDETLLGFLQDTYEAAANLAGWDRNALERGHAPGERPAREAEGPTAIV